MSCADIPDQNPSELEEMADCWRPKNIIKNFQNEIEECEKGILFFTKKAEGLKACIEKLTRP